jgi:hypothetical protein
MKIKISVPQIRSAAITHPKTDADEIYLAYFVTLAKKGTSSDSTEIKKFAAKKISSIKTHVWSKTKWQPDNLETIIDSGDAELAYLTIALFEADDMVIYNKMKDASDVLIEPDDYDWSSITIPSDFKDIFAWVKAIWKVIIASWTYFKQDDLLGTETIPMFTLTPEAASKWTGPRELTFKRYGGDYKVSLNLAVV